MLCQHSSGDPHKSPESSPTPELLIQNPNHRGLHAGERISESTARITPEKEVQVRTGVVQQVARARLAGHQQLNVLSSTHSGQKHMAKLCPVLGFSCVFWKSPLGKPCYPQRPALRHHTDTEAILTHVSEPEDPQCINQPFPETASERGLEPASTHCIQVKASWKNGPIQRSLCQGKQWMALMFKADF